MPAPRPLPGIWPAASTDRFGGAVPDQGIPASVLSDNGMVFTTRFAGGRAGRDTINGFQAELRRLGVIERHSRPNHPTTCSKVKRFHQTLKKWLRAQPRPPQTVAELQAFCNQFVAYYNSCRPHRSLNTSHSSRGLPGPAQIHPTGSCQKPSRRPGSVVMWSIATANSLSATTAGCTTSESAEPTPEPLS